MSLGERLRTAMKGRPMAEVAREAGVNWRTVQRVLRDEGKSGPDLATVERLAKACNVDPKALAFGEDGE